MLSLENSFKVAYCVLELLQIYNLFHEARTTTETTLIDEHWDNEQYDSTLYKPPKFLAFNAEKTQYLLSDLINFYGERPYILFNCRSMRLASYDINY